MLSQNKLGSLLLFLGSFALYLFSCAPYLPPYRDAGEMTTLLYTFGVAHPPGYPFYTLAGKLIMWLPLGNPAYISNVFSALMAAGALVLLFHVFRKWASALCAALGVMGFGLSIRFWELAAVPEMYSFGFLWIALLLYTFFVLENDVLLAFLFGLGLGIRMDMLLLGPLFLGVRLWEKKKLHWILSAAFFALGLSVFLYMPIRSLQDPVLDWANPEKLNNLFRSVTRASYGGTLDLLSLNYAKGENWPANLAIYGAHVKDSFGWGGMTLILMGLVSMFKLDRKNGIIFAGAFIIVGPLYLFLANMPPNPHAIAVVEANFPVADLFLAFFLVSGISLLFKTVKYKPVAAVMTAAILLFNAQNTYAIASKRNNLYVRDYINNVLKTVPRQSILALDKDVQIFSMMETQLVGKRRLDLAVISEGLSTSAWYWDMKRRWGTPVGPGESIKSEAGWLRTKAKAGSKRLFAGHDINYPRTQKIQFKGFGMVSEVMLPGEDFPSDQWIYLPELYLFRGHYIYGETPDFFSTDLIGDHGKAYHRMAFRLMLAGEYERAIAFNLHARHLDPTFPRAPGDIGYIYFTQGNFKEALVYNKEAVQKYEALLALTQQYKSLPDVVSGVKIDLTHAYVSLGATYERLNDKSRARRIYTQAIQLKPNAKSYYNMAVTYWNEDWAQVVRNLEQALKIDPQFPNGQSYLAQARARLK